MEILKKNKFKKFINGPISKRHFLKENFLGITSTAWYKHNKETYSVDLFNTTFVSPIKDDNPLVKEVHKNITKIKIY